MLSVRRKEAGHEDEKARSGLDSLAADTAGRMAFGSSSAEWAFTLFDRQPSSADSKNSLSEPRGDPAQGQRIRYSLLTP